MRPPAADYDTAHRLLLPHPLCWTVDQAREAETCVGCFARDARGTRVLFTVAGCPAHTGEQS
jgi:hypothetical protein